MADFVKTFTGNAPPHLQDRPTAVTFAGGDTAWPLALIAAFLFLPSAIRFFLGTSSNTAGLVATCLMLWAMTLARDGFRPGGFARRAVGGVLPLLIVLVVHLVIAVYLPRVPQPVGMARTAGSLVALAVIVITAGIVADWLSRASERQIDRIGHVIRITLLAIGLWCFVGWQPPSALTLSRPSFPFTEPSHYALVAGPFIIDGCARTTLARRFAWLAVWLTLGLINQSLSMIVVVAIAAIVTLPAIYSAVAFVALAVAATGIDLQYYTERLDFSVNSRNLSSLVYRQGWELMQQGLVYSRGWGIGFQQLGVTPLNVPTSDVIYRILGDDSNLRDGSFMAAKLVSELGLVGIAVVAVTVVAIVRAGLMLRAMAQVPAAMQSGRARFAAAAICAFAVELFVRGIGYFSGTAILIVAAVMVLHAAGRDREPG
jgi:hypothetical protein